MSSSNSSNTPDDWAHMISAGAYAMAGMLRRMALRLTDETMWQCEGHTLLSGDPEVQTAPPFTGVGFYSRPNESHRAEAVLGFIGGPNNPVILATRDEDGRRAAAADLGAGETAVYSTIDSPAGVYMLADGTVRAQTPGGTTRRLATVDDLQAVVTALQSLTLPVSGASAGPPLAGTFLDPTGTQVFRAE